MTEWMDLEYYPGPNEPARETASLMMWQDSSGTVLASVAIDGTLTNNKAAQ